MKGLVERYPLTTIYVLCALTLLTIAARWGA